MASIEQGSGDPAAETLRTIGREFFELRHTIDPFGATELGVPGFDHLVADPSRAGALRDARRIADLEARLRAVDERGLDDSGRIDCAVLAQLTRGVRSDLEHGLWEANASAGAYVSPQAIVFQSVPTAVLGDGAAVGSYLRRLAALGPYFDAVSERYREAAEEGRVPTAVGVAQAVEQLDGHLAVAPADDRLAVPVLAEPDDAAYGEAVAIVERTVRPAIRRLLDCLRDELARVARPDERVGIRFVPGGAEGYRAAVARHTTTDLAPEEIHELGLEHLRALEAEWAEVGRRALGIAELPAIQERLRSDPSLRFSRSSEIVATVADALRRAEAARSRWFPDFDIPDCVIEEIDPVEAGNAALAYYRPPAGGGQRPGAHCVLTAHPEERFVYEYEALAFHESSPGHHLQIASAQTLDWVPDYRRYLDADVTGYVEGWGLYCERLADEMGLYTSDLQRLGMLSFDALRATRLVVDTGMHLHGWSRARAVDFMWRHTATTAANVANEIDRYIAWPGQALGYMVGRREIARLRALAEDRLGERFDIRAFHGAVLGHGAVPLTVLARIVSTWMEATAA